MLMRKTQMKKLLTLATIVLLFGSGCGFPLFVKPEEQAVVDEHIFSNPRWYKPLTWIFEDSGVRAASTKLERRIIVFNREWKKDDGDGKKGWHLQVCAEPPPEAVQALESTSKIAAELEAQGVPLIASGTGDFALQTAVQAAFRRTQGLQFYRDAAYQICQAYLNELINMEQYRKQLKDLGKKAFILIKEEINHPNFYSSAPEKKTQDKKKDTVTKTVTEEETKKTTKQKTTKETTNK